MKLGIDQILSEAKLRKPLQGKRLALLGHPASVTKGGIHTLDALMEMDRLSITSAFGPQHGMRGEKQDNMVESDDYTDPRWKIPVFSLYGKQRKPTSQMMESFDILLVDLQDLGTRVYTFMTTLRYMLEACAKAKKSLWVLDRPNPVGRPIEGSILKQGWESFVGAGPLLMRHGLTMGEIARWLVRELSLKVDLQVVAMVDYEPDQSPGFGWPADELPWVNPSPNAPSYLMARCFPGTVLLEGTNLSEGRGTTRPLEIMGAPDIDGPRILQTMEGLAPEWLQGCRLRSTFFEPTFQKHAGNLCQGIQIHVDSPVYDHQRFQPYRLVALFLKSLRKNYREYELWHANPYEYETKRRAIDLLAGGPELRTWVDDTEADSQDLDRQLTQDEEMWRENTKDLYL